MGGILTNNKISTLFLYQRRLDCVKFPVGGGKLMVTFIIFTAATVFISSEDAKLLTFFSILLGHCYVLKCSVSNGHGQDNNFGILAVVPCYVPLLANKFAAIHIRNTISC